MTITLAIKPEVQAELTRQAAVQGRAIEAVAAALLEEALHPESVQQQAAAHRTGQALIDVCAQIRGLLTDDEVDTLFARNRSLSRPVDLS